MLRTTAGEPARAMAGPGLEEAGPATAWHQAPVLSPELEQRRSWGSADAARPMMTGRREGPGAPHEAQLRRGPCPETVRNTHRPLFLQTPPWARLKGSVTAGRGGPAEPHPLRVTAPRGHQRAGEAGARATGSRRGRRLPSLPKLKGATSHRTEAARSPDSGRHTSLGRGSGSEE